MPVIKDARPPPREGSGVVSCPRWLQAGRTPCPRHRGGRDPTLRGTPGRRRGAGGGSRCLWAVPREPPAQRHPQMRPSMGTGRVAARGVGADGNSSAAVANTWLRSGARSAAPPPGRVPASPGTAKGAGGVRGSRGPHGPAPEGLGGPWRGVAASSPPAPSGPPKLLRVVSSRCAVP